MRSKEASCKARLSECLRELEQPIRKSIQESLLLWTLLLCPLRPPDNRTSLCRVHTAYSSSDKWQLIDAPQNKNVPFQASNIGQKN